MSRIAPLQLFFLVVLLLQPAYSQGLPKIRAAYTSIAIQMDPIYIMKEVNLPRKHGLEAEMLYIPVSSRAIQSALAGEIQFLTSAGVANTNANVAGGDFVGLTATLNTFIFKIVSKPEIKEPKALKGRKVGISRLGGVSDAALRYALDLWGLVPDKDVAIIQVGGELEELLALQNKAVDAAVLSEPVATVALRTGSSLLFDLSRLGVPYSMHGFGTRKSFIRDNRDVVLRFMRAYLEGIYLFKTNKELALSVLKKYTRLDDISVMLTAYDEYSQKYIPAVPHPSPEGIQTILNQLAKTRPEVKKFTPKDLIDPTILKEIEESGFVKRLYAQ
ncbi:MAG TPA: ABC transporter substrate-binding protein [Candidatus Binatia bacterium]|nr:ABC transporter substrate-binding protein [Candidatus Binatia bacterium]